MSTSKRSRSANFTRDEELMLLEEIGKQKNKIECKTTNKVSNEEKEEAWRRVLNNLNAKSAGGMRTLEQIKSKFDNLKSKARKVVAAEKSYIRGTGGGEYKKHNDDPVIDAVLDIINYKTVVGLQSAYDCDTVVVNVINPTDSKGVEANELQITGTTENNEAETVSVSPLLIVSASVDDLDFTPSAALSPPTYTSTPGSGTVNVLQNIQLQPAFLPATAAPGSSKGTTARSGKENWSTYVPKKLQTRTSAKLRPTVMNPVVSAKAAYYQRKLELLENAEEHEANERKKRAKREEEEHLKKMQLLNLEIKVKQRQLKQNILIN